MPLPKLSNWIAASLLLAAAVTPACAGTPSRHELLKILAHQGFSGALTGDIHLTPLGSLQCRARSYQAFFFQWYDIHPAGKAIHAQSRIVMLDEHRQYLGSYVVDDKPVKVTPGSILFPYTEELGSAISCDADTLPTKARLNGEQRPLEK